MKIRIKGNTVRYRLTQSEVKKLAAVGSLEEHTDFAEKTFVYAIIATNDHTLSVNFVENGIIVSMPKRMIEKLVNTNKVGFSDNTGSVKLLIEKDFVCIDNTQEDQSDKGKGSRAANQHTWYARDAVSKQPHLKSSPVAVRKLSFGEPEPWLLERLKEMNGEIITPFAARKFGSE